MRFVEGQNGLCGGEVGLSASVAETATVRLRAWVLQMERVGYCAKFENMP